MQYEFVFNHFTVQHISMNLYFKNSPSHNQNVLFSKIPALLWFWKTKAWLSLRHTIYITSYIHNSIEVAYWDYLSLTVKYYSFIQCLCSPKSYKVLHFAKTNTLIDFAVCNICSELRISIEISYWDYLSLTVGYCSFLNLW